jgi:hypothetical protein
MTKYKKMKRLDGDDETINLASGEHSPLSSMSE